MKNSFLIIFSFLLINCSENYTPKPRAFFKLDFPQKEYHKIKFNCPFEFDLPNYAIIINGKTDCLFDIDFPKQNGKIHITYFALNNNLYEHTEESRSLAYKHNIMVDAITEQIFINDSLGVYGILYSYQGNSATSTQFFLTDSINHFFRGALYFQNEINDSILPINNFLREDIRNIIESFRWKNSKIG